MDALVFLGILFMGLIPGLCMLAQYNGLIALRNCIRRALGDIDAGLKRRYDLIPRLVEVARGYTAHEREVFERVSTLRDRCVASRGSFTAQASDETALVSGLQTLLARVEAYPHLKADPRFQSLHNELVDTEGQIQASRHLYNGYVRDYRNKCESFPGSIVAKMFGFQVAPFFTVESAICEAPELRV